MAITLEEFKARAFKDVELPGFEIGETISVKLRKVSILSLASSGKIPNSLMGVVNELFGKGASGASQEEVSKASMEHLTEMSQLLHVVAKAAMIEPKYDEVGEYLTDDQLNAIFDFSQSTVKQVTPSSAE